MTREGTGKTFTFLESIYRLNRDYGLCKFIVLVPSNPIRQGTIKNINITKEFFVKEYGKQISVYNYSEKTVLNYINAGDQSISVLVSTYQSFNKATNSINKNKIEQSLLGRTKSYMQAIAHLRPVVIIDEPHRFEGKKTVEYLREFNALFTLRFGATYRDDNYKNLIYTLDSVDAFGRGLVKAITVDSVGNESVDSHTISFVKVAGRTQADYVATVEYKDIESKKRTIELQKGENLGQKVGIEYLNSYVVERITKTELFFTNDILLLLGASESYGVLLSQMQRVIVDTAIKNHFEREEELFKLGIKSLCLFFIDRVDKYLTDTGTDGKLAKLFETLYSKNLQEVLKREDLNEKYKSYLLRTKDSLNNVHNGYFAKSKKEGDEAEAIELILSKKEELLSFDSDLRFIFSQWALQEGWDNPNVMTLAKLAPSNSKISKLQQIGRGLRLAVDQSGKRVTKDDENFEFVNELFVVVPSTEGDFVASIQNEISQNSIKRVSRVFDELVMVENGLATNVRNAVNLLNRLEEMGFVSIGEDDMSHIVIPKDEYALRSGELADLDTKGCDNAKLKEYLDSYFSASSRVKAKGRDSQKGKIKINKANFKKFRALWNSLNYDAVVRYDIDSGELISSAIKKIDKVFEISSQDIIIQRDRNIEDRSKHDSTRSTVAVGKHSIFTLYEFVKSLSNSTKLSMQTIAKVIAGIKKEKFELISKNEKEALKAISDQLVSTIYETIINKISYDLKEIKTCNTTLVDECGKVREFIYEGSLGKDRCEIEMPSVVAKSIYDEEFMEVDSQIECATINESSDKRVVVFGKLPKVNIPTAHGKSYNPDFGYVIDGGNKKELFLIVETKGYDSLEQASTEERLKIESAKMFFQKLRESGVNVKYKTKLNGDELSQMIGEILK